jgi:hypothetical protein
MSLKAALLHAKAEVHFEIPKVTLLKPVIKSLGTSLNEQ